MDFSIIIIDKEVLFMICSKEKAEKNKEMSAVEKYSFDLIKNITLDKVKGDNDNQPKKVEDCINEKNTSFLKW